MIVMTAKHDFRGRTWILGRITLGAGLGGWLAKTLSYLVMYEVALLIPAISALGVTLGQFSTRLRRLRLSRSGMDEADIRAALHQENPDLIPNWYILM